MADQDAPPHYRSDHAPNAAFDHVDTADVAEAFTTWRAACAQARAVVASFSDLDERGRDETRPGRPAVRWRPYQGKRAEAYALLAPIYHWFTEGFDTADLQEARTLLEA